MSRRVVCPVEFANPTVEFGVCANAFRVLFDESDNVVLDFCFYNLDQKTAMVLSRVRIARSFWPLVDMRICEALVEVRDVTHSICEPHDSDIIH